MNKEFNIDLLVSYVTGNCSSDEQKQVELWLNENPDNQNILEEYNSVWNSAGINDNDCLINLDRAWEDFKSKTNFEEEPEYVETKILHARLSKSIVFRVASIAALFIISLGLVYTLNFESNTNLNTISNNELAQNPDLALPDGTQIALNNNSSVKFPDEFKGEFRKVDFVGEAFFNVKSNPQQPMIIATDNIRVKVLGTSFNLSNIPGSDEISVYLEEGKVLFYSVDENETVIEQIRLKPGERAVYSRSTGVITKSKFINQNYKAWKTGKLEFVNTPLKDVFNSLSQTYDLEIEINSDINSFSLTAQYDKESIDDIFKSIELIYDLNIKQNKNLVIVN